MIKRILFSLTRSVLLALVMFAVFSCANGTIRLKRQHDNTDKRLTVYTDYVEKLSKDLAFGDNITIGMVKELNIPLNPNVIGRCAFVVGKGMEIDILESAYNRMNHYSRVFLIAHEIKHCACHHYAHTITEPKPFTECNTHYFNSSHMGNTCAQMFAKEYLAQIRKGCD